MALVQFVLSFHFPGKPDPTFPKVLPRPGDFNRRMLSEFLAFFAEMASAAITGAIGETTSMVQARCGKCLPRRWCWQLVGCGFGVLFGCFSVSSQRGVSGFGGESSLRRSTPFLILGPPARCPFSPNFVGVGFPY